MDMKVSQKIERLQPDGLVSIYVPDVFDLYLVMDGNEIVDAEVVDGDEELQQAALFASVKQRGSDPLNKEDGNRWVEAYLGEISSAALIMDVKDSVGRVSVNCNVDFSVRRDEEGREFLNYDIEVLP